MSSEAGREPFPSQQQTSPCTDTAVPPVWEERAGGAGGRGGAHSSPSLRVLTACSETGGGGGGGL